MKINKVLGTLVTVILAAGLIAGCGSSEKKAAPSPEKIIRAGCTGVSYPDSFKENGKLTGYDVEILELAAKNLGYKVEKRVIPFEELDSFEEVNACGTAVVITPIGSITDKPRLKGEEVTRVYHFGQEGVCGPVSRKLYETLRGIQDGIVPDTHGWCHIVKL